MKTPKRRAKRVNAKPGQPSADSRIPLNSEASERRNKQEEKLLNTVAEIIVNIILEEEKQTPKGDKAGAENSNSGS